MTFTLRRQTIIALAALAVLLGSSFFVWYKARASSFTVNSLLDTSDANPGDGFCDDGAGNCTLRAAIQEANSFPGADVITFSVTGTIFPSTSYPIIIDSLYYWAR